MWNIKYHYIIQLFGVKQIELLIEEFKCQNLDSFAIVRKEKGGVID